jgi:hypothetical protein
MWQRGYITINKHWPWRTYARGKCVNISTQHATAPVPNSTQITAQRNVTTMYCCSWHKVLTWHQPRHGCIMQQTTSWSYDTLHSGIRNLAYMVIVRLWSTQWSIYGTNKLCIFSPSIFMCLVWLLEQTAIISPRSTNRLIFKTEIVTNRTN